MDRVRVILSFVAEPLAGLGIVTQLHSNCLYSVSCCPRYRTTWFL